MKNNPSNKDGLLLVLGALARKNDLQIQTKVVNELLTRLDTAKSNGNSSEDIVAINYALGNTGSQLAINVLLSSLDYDNLDIKISVIRGLNVYLDQPVVQQALISVLATTSEDKILDEVLTVLNNAFYNKVLKNPNKDMLNAVVNSVVRLENRNLYASLLQYLSLVGRDEAVRNIDTIMQQYHYGDIKYDNVSSAAGISRIKRNLKWDSTADSDYNLVASYYDRRNDIINYPKQKSYLLTINSGVSKLNLQVSSGTFTGYEHTSSIKRLKAFNKLAAKVYILGRTFEVLNFEYSDVTSNDRLDHKVYMRSGSTTRVNTYQRYHLRSSCLSYKKALWPEISDSVFRLNFPFFVYIATINIYICGTVSSRGDAGICICPMELKACAHIKPSASLRVTGGVSANLLVSYYLTLHYNVF